MDSPILTTTYDVLIYVKISWNLKKEKPVRIRHGRAAVNGNET